LSQVKCLNFPAHDDQLALFFRELADLFARRNISSEDRQRTEMYRRRLEVSTLSPAAGEATDLTDFLAKLRMELTIFDRSAGDRERAIQLINKTNQFNLNGRRMTDDEVAGILVSGGRLYTARLDDRTGSHGEILACLIDGQRRIVSFVLSCRVFHRQVEYAFTCWLVRRFGRELKLGYAATKRNTPIQVFLKDAEVAVNEDDALLDGVRFLETYKSRLDLFALKEIGFD
jgi:FkbH-like protein